MSKKVFIGDNLEVMMNHEKTTLWMTCLIGTSRTQFVLNIDTVDNLLKFLEEELIEGEEGKAND